METGYQLISNHGYGALFLLLMLGIVGLPIPDEALLMFVGYLIFRGKLTVMPALAAAWMGSAMGITISYGIGRMIGPRGISKLGRFLRWKEDHLAKAQQWVRRWGGHAVLIAYFLPGLRHVGSLIVGASAISYGKFARFAYVGAIIWVSTFVSLGYIFGEEWSTRSPLVHRSAVAVAIVGALLALAAMGLWKKRLNRKGSG